jgi:hypothetical protein
MSIRPFQARVINARNNTYELRLFREGETHYEARTRRDKELHVLASRRSSKGAPLWMTASAARINRVRPFTVGAARRLLVPDDLFIISERRLRRQFDVRMLREMGSVLFCSECGAAGVLTWSVPAEVYRILRNQPLICGKCEGNTNGKKKVS